VPRSSQPSTPPLPSPVVASVLHLYLPYLVCLPCALCIGCCVVCGDVLPVRGLLPTCSSLCGFNLLNRCTSSCFLCRCYPFDTVLLRSRKAAQALVWALTAGVVRQDGGCRQLALAQHACAGMAVPHILGTFVPYVFFQCWRLQTLNCRVCVHWWVWLGVFADDILRICHVQQVEGKL
jgi:hypothetical protein